MQLSQPAVRERLSFTRSLSPRYRDAALFIVLASLFGGSFVAIKTGLRELPPLLFAGLRFDLAAVVLLAYVAMKFPRSAWLPRTRGDMLAIAAAAVFLVLLNNGLLFLGQETTTPAAASVMYGLNPILAPVFAWWLLGERLSRLGAIGIGVALGGVVLIVQPSPLTFTDGSAMGQLLVLAAAAAVALGSVVLRHVEPRMDSVPLTAWGMATGAVLLHVASLAVGEAQQSVVSISPVTIVSLVAVAIPSTAVAYAIYFGLIERVGPVRANLVAYVVPVFAALIGWLLLGAIVSLWTAVGFLVVVAGFMLIERDTIRSEYCRLRRHLRDEATPDAVPPCDD
ncbi:DMT family transporter [Halomicroarcula sp. GCM10025817]|uniref:DMT family transporter n=1 Tax=Haloarcula TaxID=2237 RepID=UPI0023E79BD5|nr:EamA family transporter [Halomicroarcula sp. SYNS111]